MDYHRAVHSFCIIKNKAATVFNDRLGGKGKGIPYGCKTIFLESLYTALYLEVRSKIQFI